MWQDEGGWYWWKKGLACHATLGNRLQEFILKVYEITPSYYWISGLHFSMIYTKEKVFLLCDRL